MKKQDILYNVPALIFLSNALLFSLNLLFDENVINYLFSFSIITLVLTIGSISFILGLLLSSEYFVPIRKVQDEEHEIDLKKHDFNSSSLINFEFSLNLIDDIDDCMDTMATSQLRMLAEKLKQVFIYIEAIELQELKSFALGEEDLGESESDFRNSTISDTIVSLNGEKVNGEKVNGEKVNGEKVNGEKESDPGEIFPSEESDPGDPEDEEE